MAATLGFTALLLIISLTTFLPIYNFYHSKYKKNQIELEQISFATISAIFILALFAQCCLIYSYAVSDYSLLNVYQNSHHLKPLLFKIVGSWGNHEGSMLLLLSVISFYSFVFAIIDKSKYKSLTIASQCLIILGFASFTAFTSNPFTKIFPAPLEGLGLNAVLQDIGLALHPPMLYMGYIGFSLAFSLVIAALIKEKIDANFAKILQFWLYISWGFLTLGIGLGSWWAYRELGWGGYWFWDPVENVSLMPWLASTALIHCVKLLKSQNMCKIWTALLAIINFTLCLIGIFLTRSGLLTSVHSFAVDAKRGFFIILLILIISGLAFLIFAFKANKIKGETPKQNIIFFSKIGVIFANNYLLIIALFTIFLGTLYPIFSQNFFDQPLAIGAKYYNQIFAILLLPFLIFLIISYFLHYKEKISLKTILTTKNLLILLASSAICFLFYFYKKPLVLTEFSQIILLFLAINASFLALFSKKSVSNLAHLGFTLLVIGIIMSATGLVKEVNIKQGDNISILTNSSKNSNYQINFDDIEYLAGQNFLARVGVFKITQNDQEIKKLSPQLRYYPASQQTTNEAAIWHSFFGDLYLAIGNKDENNFYALRIYYKPFIYLIWLGCLIIFVAAFIKVLAIFLVKKNEVL